jgi:hypothetical protein
MSDFNTKAQKISSAIYLVTSFFTDQEPLKWRLRTLSTHLISEEVKDKKALITEITSLFVLAKNSNLIADTNFTILSQELSKLSENMETSLAISFPKELPQPEPKTSVSTPIARVPERVSSGTAFSQMDYLSMEDIRDNIREERAFKPEEKADLKNFGAVSVKKNSRQSVIISLLKRKKEIMIKDVSPLISNCSEKTIQRELLAMVQAGVLKKVGEKRWSRYTLA